MAAVWRALELTAWGLLAVVWAAWLALVEVFWLPLRVGGLLLPVSIAGAAVGNLLLVDLVYRRTGSRLLAMLPALTWLGVAFSASLRRPEGDLLLIGTGAPGLLNLAFLLVGVVAAAVAVGRVLSRPRPAPVSPPVGARDPAGSGSGGAR